MHVVHPGPDPSILAGPVDAAPGDATPVEVRLERFVAGGEALGHDPDGRVVFVAGGLPGEVVRAVETERKDRWSRAVLIDVVESSTDRVAPPCPRRREGCGGCDWQHAEPDAQRRARVDIVRDALRRTGGMQPEAIDRLLVDAGTVPNIGYRTTVRVVGGADGRASFRAERSDRTVSASGCLVAHPELVDLIERVEVDPGV